ncbi:hypothetical protein [Pragia fontium]|uniref:hypothetical protein n=1 Tax=Pragia fontium TaxID=82985 RepID=UPI000F6DD084|nr:hypothetical protein [Pragia fontium]VEJ54654.1 Uncharacterised protein [Pragia fontium]
MSIKTIVALYRILPTPEYNSERRLFSCECKYTQEIRQAILDVIQTKASIKELSVNGDCIDYDTEPLPDPKNDDVLRIEVKAPSNSSTSFFLDINDFLGRVSNSEFLKGELPEQFFIVSDNYFSLDENTNSKIESLKNLFKFTDCLSKMAHYQDNNVDKLSRKLVFFKRTEKSLQPLAIDIDFNDASLLNTTLNFKILLDLHGSAKNDLHINEKKNIFISSLIELLFDIGEDKSFSYLIKNWDELLKLFNNNLDVYLSNFSFHKVRQEIASTEIELADKCAKTLSDIQAKLLGIPISFTVVIGMLKSDSMFVLEQILCVAGLLLTSLVISSIVKTQLDNFNSIKHASEVSFGGFNEKADSPSLVDLIEKAKDNLSKQQVSTKRWLTFFRVISWSPFLLGLCTFVYKYNIPQTAIAVAKNIL